MSLTKQKFNELFALGWTYKEMSRALKVSETYLYLIAKELGLPPRRRGRRKAQ